jgi:hypothetical protein
MKHGFFAVDHQRVAGVVAALKAHHGARTVSEQVHYFAFALVAPLGTDHYDRFAQRFSPKKILNSVDRRAGVSLNGWW